MKSLFVIFIILISQNSFSQFNDGFSIGRDKDGNIVMGGESVFSYEGPDKNDSPSVENSNDDRPNNSNPKDSYSFEHSGEAGESGKSNGNSGNKNGSGGSGNFYSGVIQKSRTDSNFATKNAQNADTQFQKNRIELGEFATTTKDADVQHSYQREEGLVSDEITQKISYLIGSLVVSNQTTLFSSFTGQYQNNNLENEIYMQNALKKELRVIFPEVYQQNIQQIKQAQQILRNWTLVNSLMKNSGFDLSLIDAENAIANVQKTVDLTGLGPVDRQLMGRIDQFNQASFSRFADYISSYLASIPSSEYDVGIDQKKEAERFIIDAFKSVSQNQDFLAAASSLLQAKEIFKYSEPPHESAFGPVDVIGVGSVVASLGKGIARYGIKEILTKALTAEERNLVRRALTQYVDNGITVLGKKGSYVELGNKMQARTFNIPDEIWNKLSEPEQWTVNQKFLDIGIKRGERFVFSNKVEDVSKVRGMFRKELDYMIEVKKYKLRNDGLELISP